MCYELGFLFLKALHTFQAEWKLNMTSVFYRKMDCNICKEAYEFGKLTTRHRPKTTVSVPHWVILHKKSAKEFKIGISLLSVLYFMALLKCKITCTNFELFVHGALLSTALFRYKHIETTGIVCIVFKYLTRPKGLLAYFSIKTTNLFDPVFLTR